MLEFNTEGLYQIMRDFYILTKIRIVIFNAEFRELLAYPRERGAFCEWMRRTPDGDARCAASDKNGCVQCAKRKGLVTYRCHAGLTEVVAPILDKNQVLSYVMFGQIIPKEDCDATRECIREAFPQYAGYIEQIPVKSRQELGAVTTVLQALTAVITANRWVLPGKSEFIGRLDRYIESHLTQHIAVADVCEVFHIGRTKLYEISMDYLGCGLAEYIRTQRVLHAQKLLLESEKSITDIAYDVGFTDYTHFSRVFKQISGMSARDYRKTGGQG